MDVVNGNDWNYVSNKSRKVFELILEAHAHLSRLEAMTGQKSELCDVSFGYLNA